MRPVWLVIFGLTTVATLLPLVSFGAGDRYWPGLFYAPFYTNAVFTDPATPAARAGLRPEDRVIGQNGVRIEFLRELVTAEGRLGGNVSLVYELGRELAAIKVPVEQLGFERLFDKWAVFVLGGFGLAGWGWRKKSGLAMAGAVLLMVSGDYWLNPGAERLSGFDPASFLASGEWGMATTKWSTYFNWPLWVLVWLVVGLELAGRLKTRRRVVKLLRSVLATLALTELAVYIYEAARTARFNNPDYITFHLRLVWWPGWLLLLFLGLWVAVQRNRWQIWLALVGLIMLVVGFGATTLYAVEVPGPGPQWYALGLVLASWAWNYSGKTARPRSNSAG